MDKIPHLTGKKIHPRRVKKTDADVSNLIRGRNYLFFISFWDGKYIERLLRGTFVKYDNEEWLTIRNWSQSDTGKGGDWIWERENPHERGIKIANIKRVKAYAEGDYHSELSSGVSAFSTSQMRKFTSSAKKTSARKTSSATKRSRKSSRGGKKSKKRRPRKY